MTSPLSSSLPDIARLISQVGAAVRTGAKHVCAALSLQDVSQVPGDAAGGPPGCPKLIRVDSTDLSGNRRVLNAGTDASFSRRRASFEERNVKRAGRFDMRRHFESVPNFVKRDMKVFKASSWPGLPAGKSKLPTTISELRAMSKPLLPVFTLPRPSVADVGTAVAGTAGGLQARTAPALHGSDQDVCPPRDSWLHRPIQPPSETASSLPSLDQASVGGVASVASSTASAVFDSPSHEPEQSITSNISRYLRHAFSLPERTTGEKLGKLTDELRRMDILYWPLDRGERAKQLLAEVSVKHRDEGERAAYAFAKESIVGVRKADLRTSAEYHKAYGPRTVYRSV